MQVRLENPLLSKLRDGQLGLALVVRQMRSGDVALAAATCGFDAVYVDLEHSTMSLQEAASICLGGLHAGITPLIRIPSLSSDACIKLLDAGALGVVVPHVESADDARAAVQACKFAPIGSRSVAGGWPQLAYQSVPNDEARQALNDATMVIAMLETADAIEQADEIAAVPGIDVLHIGTADLRSATGINSADSLALEQLVEKVVKACRRHGKIAGLGGMASSPEVAGRYFNRGIKFITAGSDWGLFMTEAKNRSKMMRKAFLECQNS